MNSKRLLYYCIWYGIAFLFLAYSWMTFRVYFASSEIWSVNLGFHFWQEVQHTWVNSRLAFYLPLSLVQIFTDEPIFNLYAARALMLAWTLVMIASIHRFLKSYHSESKENYFWALAVVLGLIFSNTTFLNQGFRIRSDFFATVFALWSLTYFMFDSKKSVVKDVVFFLLPMLATPKAIIYVIGFLIFQPWQRIWSSSRGKVFLVLGIIAAGATSSILYFDSFLFLQNAVFQHAGSPDYFSRLSFFHVFKSLKHNPLFYLLLARVAYLSVVAVLDRGLRNLSMWQKFEVFCLSVTFLFLIQPEKVPYLIASVLPFWAIWVHPWILNWAFEFSLRKFAIGFTVIVLLVVVSTHWTIRNIQENFNSYQLEVIHDLNRYMQANNVSSYVDGIGLVPAKDPYRVFIGPNTFESAQTIERLVSEAAPDMILMTSAMVPLEALQNYVLNEKYMIMQRGAFVRAYNFRKMNRDQIEKFISENQHKVPTDRLVVAEIITANKGQIENVERINLTLQQLLRKYNDIITTKRSGNTRSVYIGKVCLFPELKVSMRDSLEYLFAVDVNF